ncbi:hypothetical protein J7M00_03870 [bacterium]|nr:hypothetical protein [bacterium]
MKKWALFLIFSISCIVPALVIRTFTGAESDNYETHLSVAGSTSVESRENLSIEHGKFSSANFTSSGIIYSYHSELNVDGTFNNYGSLTLQDFSKFRVCN